MNDINKIFRMPAKVEHSFTAPNKSIEATEDYAIKKVVITKELYADNITGDISASKIQTHDVTSVVPTDGKILVYRTASSAYVLEDKPTSGGTPTWGSITGTLSDQTDLNTALVGKVATTSFNTHVASTSIHFTKDSIDHTGISNIGTKTHAQIDKYIASTWVPLNNKIHYLNNLAIGTSYNSNSKVTISDSNSVKTLRIMSNSVTTNHTAGLAFGVSGSYQTKSGIAHARRSSNGQGNMLFLVDPSNDANDVDAGDVVMTIQGSTGYVGVGVTSPTSRLDVSGNITVSGSVDGVDVAGLNSSYDTHVASSAIHWTKASLTELESGCVAKDHGTASTDMIVNVCYGTSATPPTASNTTEGTIYFQYTA